MVGLIGIKATQPSWGLGLAELDNINIIIFLGVPNNFRCPKLTRFFLILECLSRYHFHFLVAVMVTRSLDLAVLVKHLHVNKYQPSGFRGTH